MIDLIVVALVQAAAGEPQAQSPPPETQAAQPATSPAPTQQASVTADARGKTRCRTIRRTGSRLPTRLCLTEGQEQDIADESRDQINRIQSQLPAQGN